MSSAETLVITYLGMETQEIRVQSVVNVVLNSDLKALDEVVVTALGISREKKSLGYAIQEVKSDELTQGGQLSVTGALSGKVAGVQINQFGGTVGSSARISIRGNSSLADEQQPLIVVDGIPIANDTQRSGDNTYNGVDYGSGLNDINPEDIESITVLKGGSAALYGMRAGNGVILITTKSGKRAKGVTVSYDGSFTVDRISTIPKLQNSYGQGYNGDEYHYNQYTAANGSMTYQEYAERRSFNYVDGSNGVYDNFDESWGPRLDAGLKLAQFDSPIVGGVRQQTDWVSRKNNIKDFFQTGYSMNHTVSVVSSGERANTRASLSFRDQTGTVPNTDQKRYSGQLSSDFTINEYLSFDLSANYTRTKSDNLPAQGYGSSNPINGLFLWSARQINMQSLKDNWDQKDPATGQYSFYNWNANYHLNPYFTVNKNTNGYHRDRIFAKSSLYYQPLEYLKFEGRLGVDNYNAEMFERRYFDFDYPSGGFNKENVRNTELNLDFMASFNKTFGDFNVSAIAGANYRDETYAYSLLGASAMTVLGVYTIGNMRGEATTEMDHSHIRSNSIYASGSVGWRSQLYLDLSMRNDWSSTIKDAFFYPSVSMSWIATESFDWLKGDILSFLKLRGVWAEIGAATTAYKNRSYYYSLMDSDNGSFNGVAQMYKTLIYPNTELKPESIRTWEVGLDVGFFDDRLHADVAYYFKSTKDQIMELTTTNTVGFERMLINAGEIQNKGVELQLRGDIFRSRNGFNWTSILNYSKDVSKVIELHPDMPVYQMGWTWGIQTIAQEGEKWGNLRGTGYARTDDGAIIVNANGLIQSSASQILGNVTPKFLMGWRNEFGYKNLSFGFFLDMRIGGDIWSQSMNHSYVAGTAEETVKGGIRERAIVAGRDVMTDERFVKNVGTADAPVYVENDIETNAQTWFSSGGVNEMYVFDGSYLKLREANITYVFPTKWLNKTKYISRASVSLIGSNLALLWTHKSNTLRLDPETGGVSSDTRGIGFEQASVPSSRSFGLKLNLTF